MTGGSAVEAENQPTAAPTPAPRRPRVREVRSRFMSPVVSSSSSSDLHLPASKSPKTSLEPQHRSTSAQRRRQLDLEPLSENRTDISRSLDTPLVCPLQSSKPVMSTLRRLPSSRSVKENGDPDNMGKFPSRTSSRCDTPNVSTSMDRMMRSSLKRSVSAGPTAASKLLQASGMSMSMSFSGSQGSTVRSRAEGNSSQDGDLDCHRSGIDYNSSKFAVSPCSRSLTSSPVSSCENPPLRASEKVVASLFRFGNTGKIPLPPVPPCAAKPKAKKVSSHQEDVHSLRMLHNHYLQWRFANAKAEASARVQKREAERMLYALTIKIAELYDSVKGKRAELGTLQRIKNVSAILDNQMPYLDEWSALEEDYLTSLSEATQSLLNASFQLPVGANVRADVREVKEAVNSALKIMEAIALNVQSFMPKAEQVDVFISELARVAGGERILVEECGDLLSKTYLSQVVECSLRGQIIQLQQLPSVPRFSR